MSKPLVSCSWGCGESVNPPKLNIQEVQGALSSRPKGDPRPRPITHLQDFYFCQITPLKLVLEVRGIKDIIFWHSALVLIIVFIFKGATLISCINIYTYLYLHKITQHFMQGDLWHWCQNWGENKKYSSALNYRSKNYISSWESIWLIVWV